VNSARRGPIRDTRVKDDLDRTLRENAALMDALGRLINAQFEAGRRDPTFAERLVDLSHRAQDLSLSVRRNKRSAARANQLADARELSLLLQKALDDASGWSATRTIADRVEAELNALRAENEKTTAKPRPKQTPKVQQPPAEPAPDPPLKPRRGPREVFRDGKWQEP